MRKSVVLLPSPGLYRQTSVIASRRNSCLVSIAELYSHQLGNLLFLPDYSSAYIRRRDRFFEGNLST